MGEPKSAIIAVMYEQGQKEEGLKGADLMAYVIEKAELSPDISESTFYRLRKHGLALVKKDRK